jgi:hypothetical protein
MYVCMCLPIYLSACLSQFILLCKSVYCSAVEEAFLNGISGIYVDSVLNYILVLSCISKYGIYVIQNEISATKEDIFTMSLYVSVLQEA